MVLVDNNNTSDPYINLAIEEFLIREFPANDTTYVLFYINEPCIVPGRNQCIYKEVKFEFLRNGKLKLCRRISGGGTVYHDEGNLNFAFVTRFSEEKINNYIFFNQPLAEALIRAGLDIRMDERNNMLCQGEKFSGSAQFTNRKNIISHGTMLVNSDLGTLKSCLGENDFKIESRAVNSVRSAVINIGNAGEQFSTAKELHRYLLKQLDLKEVYQFSKEDWQSIISLAESKFRSFDWIYGRSPAAKIVRGEIEIVVEDGRISSLIHPFPFKIDLRGVAYEYHQIKKALENYSGASEILNMIF